jgi:hypothetical protein
MGVSLQHQLPQLTPCRSCLNHSSPHTFRASNMQRRSNSLRSEPDSSSSHANSLDHSVNSSISHLPNFPESATNAERGASAWVEIAVDRFYCTFVRPEPRLLVLNMFPDPKPIKTCKPCMDRHRRSSMTSYIAFSFAPKPATMTEVVVNLVRHENALCFACRGDYLEKLANSSSFQKGCRKLVEDIRHVLSSSKVMANLIDKDCIVLARKQEPRTQSGTSVPLFQ